MTALLFAAAVSASAVSAGAAPRIIDRPAPDFSLPRLTAGEVSLSQLRGKVVVLVVASSMASAPGSRDWMIALLKTLEDRTVEAYNVTIIDKPWWMPRSAARSKLRDFAPKWGHSRVLVEWDEHFRDRYGLQWAREPYVIVIDKAGVVRLAQRTQPKAEVFKDVVRLVESLRNA